MNYVGVIFNDAPIYEYIFSFTQILQLELQFSSLTTLVIA